MNWHIVRTIVLKDLKLVLRNKMAARAMLMLPVILTVIVPAIILLVAQSPELNSAGEMAEIALLVTNMPASLRQELSGLEGGQMFIKAMLGMLFAPMFLMLPLMVSGTVGAESFAGEKERKTLEALFYTPASDRELFIAKILAAFILAVGLAWLSFVLYGVVLNLLGYPVMGQLWFPTLVWYPLMLWVVPAVSLLGVAGSVIISSRVSTFMDAYQASAALVIPVILILIGQFAGVLYLTVELILLFGLIIWIIDFVLIAVGIRLFSRSQMMARL